VLGTQGGFVLGTQGGFVLGTQGGFVLGTQGGFVLGTQGGFALALFQGWGGRVKYCWKLYSCNFSFRKKFIIFFVWPFSRQ